MQGLRHGGRHGRPGRNHRTAYQLEGEQHSKQVYVFYKGDYICISGKRGLPHWRPTRPRWPGVLPALVFPLS